MMPAMALPLEHPTSTTRPAAHPRPFVVVLLATDLSATSMPAEDEAVRLAAALHARLVAVSVIDPGTLRGSGGRFEARVDQVRGDREASAQDLVSRARAAGVSTQFLVWTGDPGESILDAAEAEAADLIVLGTHGRRGLDRSLFGSVSDHVVRHAPCPVVVIRGPG